MCKEKHFSTYIVRKALETKKPIEPYSKRPNKNNLEYLEGYMFEIVGKEK